MRDCRLRTLRRASPSSLHPGAGKHAQISVGRLEEGREKRANGAKASIHNADICTVLLLSRGRGGGVGDYLTGGRDSR